MPVRKQVAHGVRPVRGRVLKDGRTVWRSSLRDLKFGHFALIAPVRDHLDIVPGAWHNVLSAR